MESESVSGETTSGFSLDALITARIFSEHAFIRIRYWLHKKIKHAILAIRANQHPGTTPILGLIPVT